MCDALPAVTLSARGDSTCSLDVVQKIKSNVCKSSTEVCVAPRLLGKWLFTCRWSRIPAKQHANPATEKKNNHNTDTENGKNPRLCSASRADVLYPYFYRIPCLSQLPVKHFPGNLFSTTNTFAFGLVLFACFKYVKGSNAPEQRGPRERVDYRLYIYFLVLVILRSELQLSATRRHVMSSENAFIELLGKAQ